MSLRRSGWWGLLFLTASVADWIALRTGRANHPPWILAALVAGALVFFGLCALTLVVDLWRERQARGRRSAELAMIGGILVALVAGFVNWARGLQGFVILNEGEAVHLEGGSELQVFEAGPLARLEEMGIRLELHKVELAPAPDGGFFPLSRFAFTTEAGETEILEVSPMQGAESGKLLFAQGAFGFAPQIVILREGEVLFDRVVPFLTRLEGPRGVAFEGHFTLEKQDLGVAGTIDLASLDEALRGHSTLVLSLEYQDSIIGSGPLQPGHFASLEEGFRVGFVGLEKWSEIDVFRRNYARVVLAGALVALLGLLAWPVAVWRGW